MRHPLGETATEDNVYWTLASSCRRLVPGLCHISLALIDSQECLHFYSLSAQRGTGHAHMIMLPLDNTSAGLAARFRRPVFTSKLGKRGLRRLDWVHLRKAVGAEALLCIPVCTTEGVLGVLSLASGNSLSICKFQRELEFFATSIGPALSIRRQRMEARVTEDLLARMYPAHIRDRMQELQTPLRPPMPHEVVSALSEAPSFSAVPVTGRSMPSSRSTSHASSTELASPLPSIAETEELGVGSQTALARCAAASLSSPDLSCLLEASTASGLQVGARRSAAEAEAHSPQMAWLPEAASTGARCHQSCMSDGGEERSQPQEHQCTVEPDQLLTMTQHGAARNPPAMACQQARAGESTHSVAWTAGGAQGPGSKSCKQRSAMYAPALVLEASAVLLTVMALLSAVCRKLPHLGTQSTPVASMAGGLCSVVAAFMFFNPSLRPSKHSILAGTRIVRTALFAAHLATSPSGASLLPGIQLAKDSGALLIAFMAFVCPVPFRQHVVTQLACLQLLLLADIVGAVLQKATLGLTLTNGATQLLVGAVAPSFILRQLEMRKVY